MTVIETARNNPTPNQQQNILNIYGREDYTAAAPRRPPPHLTSQARTGGTKTTAKKTQHSNSTSQKSEPTTTRLNANPKQNGNLWDGADTDNTYVYPHLRLQPQHPRHRHASPIHSQQPREPPYAAGPPTTTRTSETILQRRGVDKNNAPRVHS